MSSGQLLYNWSKEAERPKLKILHRVASLHERLYDFKVLFEAKQGRKPNPMTAPPFKKAHQTKIRVLFYTQFGINDIPFKAMKRMEN